MSKDRLGRSLMALVVMLTIAAFADGIRRMGIATTDRIWIETWRTFAYMMSSRVNAEGPLASGVGPVSAQLRSALRHSPVVYRLRLITADPLSLSNRTVWLAPRTTMWITPEIEYSLL
jgi:hypothetical protein